MHQRSVSNMQGCRSRISCPRLPAPRFSIRLRKRNTDRKERGAPVSALADCGSAPSNDVSITHSWLPRGLRTANDSGQQDVADARVGSRRTTARACGSQLECQCLSSLGIIEVTCGQTDGCLWPRKRRRSTDLGRLLGALAWRPLRHDEKSPRQSTARLQAYKPGPFYSSLDSALLYCLGWPRSRVVPAAAASDLQSGSAMMLTRHSSPKSNSA
ncbi:hypothetical protein ANO11243_067750 [Dothideomycetidae sp. 11243]|nr:hypothetical protein ANO11243_067750 [fungal sp. No.11243]